MRLYGTLDGNLVRGRSAYELACMNGYTGTEKEWLETLKGEPGEKGETGDPGVYIGTDEPTDEDVRVWVDPDGGADELPGLKYVKDDPSDHGGVIEGWVNLPENPPAGMYINSASGNYSHAEGYGTIASGQWSHSENAFNTADGEAAHAEGYQTEAHGADAHSEGQYTKARSHASHAEGVSTTAINSAAHAEGNGTVARGQNSHCEGLGTIAAGQNQHVQGKYNVEDSNNTYAMIIGNGTSDGNRSNAFALKWDGAFVLANGSEIQPYEMAVCYHISSLYQEQGSTNIVGDIIGTFDRTLPKGKTILMSYEGECYYYSTSYFSYIDYHVWSTPVMYDKTDTTTPRLFVKTFTSYDLQKFTFKKVYLDELATTTSNGFMSATDKQRLDTIYAALTASGVI